MMRVSLLPTYHQLDQVFLTDKSAVIIDVLRATSTIATAIANGAAAVIPHSSQRECEDKANFFSADSYLLGGEYQGKSLPGFDLGSSPVQYSSQVVQGKTILFTSTNGAKAIQGASQAQEVLLSSLLNGEAAAQYLSKNYRDIVIVCSGTRGLCSLEDTYGAGMLISHLLQKKAYCLDDLSQVALRFYLDNQNSAPNIFFQSQAGQNLLKLGLEDDIRYCSQKNILKVVPKYNNGAIVAS